MEDLSVSILIDNKKTKNRAIDIPKRTPSIWIPDNKAMKCFDCCVPFSIINRKHHCRVCGRVFCRNCTTFTETINQFVNTTTPPSYYDNYLYKFQWNNGFRLCSDCNTHSSIANNSQTHIVLFSNIPFTIQNLMKLRVISKKWCSSINFILSTFRSIQYKLPQQKITKLEKKFIWNHRYEYNRHYYWITKCITLNNDACKLEMEKLVNYYLKQTKYKRCKHLLCSSRCKNTLYAEHILEMCFYGDLNDKNIEKLVIFYLSKKINIFILYLMPWFIEIMKKNKEIGWKIIIECIDDENLAYHFYFEIKFYLTNIENKNLKELFLKFKSHLHERIRNEISKTDNFIRFVRQVLKNPPIKRGKMIKNWFLENDYVKLPWNKNQVCIGIDVDNIKILSSQSKPVVVPFILKNKTIINVLVKNEDLRKDKLTMYISKWINVFCINLLKLKTYNVLCYDSEYGWIEMIPDVKTLYDLQYNECKTLTNYLMDNNPDITVSILRENFINTCVGSCVLSYILGVGDRHQENILISKKGELINVDFSYILGEDPKHVNCEMKITKEMLDMLGGFNSNNFLKFKRKCISVYKKIRKYSSFWYLLLTYLAFNEPFIDNFYDKYSIIKKHVIERLVPGEFDDESSTQIVEIVDKSSSESYMSRFSDLTHHIANKAKEWGEMFHFSD